MSPVEVLFGFFFSIFGVILHIAYERQSQPKIDSDRQKILKGVWTGKFKQEANEIRKSSEEFSLKIKIDPGKRMITGKMWVTDGIDFEFTLEGTFYHDKYLRLHYSPTGNNKGFIDFGSILLVVGDRPNKMNGRVMGYGSVSGTLISGTLELGKLE